MLGAVVVQQREMVFQGLAPITGDAVRFFYPLLELMGNTLQSGVLPGWNPHQMAGAPLMGDPQSGWGAVVPMLAYTFLPLADATAVNLVSLTSVSAVGMLLFLRSTGVSVGGATLGSLSYALGTFPYKFQYNPTYIGMIVWLPWLLLGADLALRHRGRTMAAGWLLCGFGASQEIGSWFGQGSYYAFTATVAYVAFMTLIGPLASGLSVRRRLLDFALHSVALTASVAALSAWGLVPRVEFLLNSTLRNGYSATEEQFGSGATIGSLVNYLKPGGSYVGAAIVLLVIAAVLTRPNRMQGFYIAMTAGCFAASLRWLPSLAKDNPEARQFFSFVPGLTPLHLHKPEIITFLCLFFAAALAATTLDRVLVAKGRDRYLFLGSIVLALAVLLVLAGPDRAFSSGYSLYFVGLGAAAGLVFLAWRGWLPIGVATALLLLVTAAELVQSVAIDRNAQMGDANQYYRYWGENASVELVVNQPGDGRYFGFIPEAMNSSHVAYRGYPQQQVVRRLLTTGQGTRYGLRDIQGYNPLHLATFDRMLYHINGRMLQDYRNAYVWRSGLESPLLAMLNARFVVTLREQEMPAQYRLGTVRSRTVWVYRNTAALPRVWVVHDTIVGSQEETLRAIESGFVDPRLVALVEQPVAGLLPSTGQEQTSVLRYDANRIEASVQLTAPGLVVFSELDYPAWKVQVDGVSRPVVRVNGGLRAVVVPAGEHTVVWRYDSTPSNVGMLVTALTLLGAAVALVASYAIPWFRARRRRARDGQDAPAGA